MDRLILRFDAEADNDLMLCEHRGVAYQRDMSKGRIDYGAAYLENYDRYAAGPISDAINAGRVALVARHAPAGASVLDFGAASGIFVRQAARAGFAARGFDVIPDQDKAVATTLDAGAAPWQNKLDDTLQGASAAACTSCHQSTDAKGHAYQNGWTPQTFENGRQTIIDTK